MRASLVPFPSSEEESGLVGVTQNARFYAFPPACQLSARFRAFIREEGNMMIPSVQARRPAVSVTCFPQRMSELRRFDTRTGGTARRATGDSREK